MLRPRPTMIDLTDEDVHDYLLRAELMGFHPSGWRVNREVPVPYLSNATSSSYVGNGTQRFWADAIFEDHTAMSAVPTSPSQPLTYEACGAVSSVADDIAVYGPRDRHDPWRASPVSSSTGCSKEARRQRHDSAWSETTDGLRVQQEVSDANESASSDILGGVTPMSRDRLVQDAQSYDDDDDELDHAHHREGSYEAEEEDSPEESISASGNDRDQLESQGTRSDFQFDRAGSESSVINHCETSQDDHSRAASRLGNPNSDNCSRRAIDGWSNEDEDESPLDELTDRVSAAIEKLRVSGLIRHSTGISRGEDIRAPSFGEPQTSLVMMESVSPLMHGTRQHTDCPQHERPLSAPESASTPNDRLGTDRYGVTNLRSRRAFSISMLTQVGPIEARTHRSTVQRRPIVRRTRESRAEQENVDDLAHVLEARGAATFQQRRSLDSSTPPPVGRLEQYLRQG